MRRPVAVVAAGSGIGLVFDLLVWGHVPGASFPLMVASLVALLLGTARLEGVTPSRGALVLLGPIGLLALVPAVRREPLTVSLAVLLCLGLGGLFAVTLREGTWLRFRVRDHVLAGVDLARGTVVGAVTTLAAAAASARGDEALGHARRAAPAVRGVAVAVPVVGVFAVLLGSADPVFASRIFDVLDVVRPLSLPRPGWRTGAAVVVALAATGLATFAVRSAPRALVTGPPLPRRTGFLEAAIVLGSVVALFAAFVTTQAQVALGGDAAVAAAGTTYAEYARRGFFELMVVALCSLVLLLLLAGTTARVTARQRRLFSSLSVALVALVLVLLVSAAARLGLYEQAYGFTRTRVAAHAVLPWLAVLLVSAAAMEVRDRLRLFPTAVLAAAVGLVLTLAAVDVDRFVVAGNLERADRGVGVELDRWYLAGLSADAVPALAAAAADPGLGEVLACHARELTAVPWQSASWSTWRAGRVLADLDLPAVTSGTCAYLREWR